MGNQIIKPGLIGGREFSSQELNDIAETVKRTIEDRRSPKSQSNQA